jgi:hypothetical protein
MKVRESPKQICRKVVRVEVGINKCQYGRVVDLSLLKQNLHNTRPELGRVGSSLLFVIQEFDVRGY